MKIIAHRGASGHEFENSMSAFKKTIELGSDMIEFDVHKCKDGFVIIHDDDLDRVTNGTGPVSERSMDDLRANVRLKNGEPIPTLKEVCQLFSDAGIRGIFDIKNEDTASEIYDEVKIDFDPTNFVYASFFPEQLQQVRAKDPNVITATILVPDENFKEQVESFKYDAVSLCLETTTKELVDALKARGLPCIVWTVNEEKDIEYALSLGVDGIITDYPDRLLNRKGAKGLRPMDN